MVYAITHETAVDTLRPSVPFSGHRVRLDLRERSSVLFLTLSGRRVSQSLPRKPIPGV